MKFFKFFRKVISSFGLIYIDNETVSNYFLIGISLMIIAEIIILIKSYQITRISVEVVLYISEVSELIVCIITLINRLWSNVNLAYVSLFFIIFIPSQLCIIFIQNKW